MADEVRDRSAIGAQLTGGDPAVIKRETRSMSSLPSISVVTICKNAAATIERTMDSVARCTYPKLQYVVVDGGSSDGTLATIERFRHKVDKFVSEPDNGISDALNKAVELTDGDYHLIVHADDVLLPNALLDMIKMSRPGESKVICGSVSVIGDGRVSRIFKPEPGKLSTKMSVPHMGSLIGRDAWLAAGRYDVRRKIAMDHLLMLRILNRFGVRAFAVADVMVANYFLGGMSDRYIDAGFREVRENLIEEGYGRLHANAAYWLLFLKSKLSRMK